MGVVDFVDGSGEARAASSLALAFGYALLGALTACAGDSTRTVAPPRAESSSTTSSPATGKDLAGAVRSVKGVAECCDVIGPDQVTFVLGSGDSVELRRSPITARSLEDPRRGLHSDDYKKLEGGGLVLTGTNESGQLVVVFDCGSETSSSSVTRYSLATAFGAEDAVLAIVPGLSTAVGCTRPRSVSQRVSVSAPTECLGLPSDPPGCGKGPDW